MDRLGLVYNIIDKLEEGIIYVDKHKNIEIVNQKAKEILGITLNNMKHTHQQGTIQTGDIVIIVDNMLGSDDGGLFPKDLAVLNVNDEDIKKDDMIIAIGVFKNNEIQAVYKYWRKSEIALKHEITTKFMNFDIKASIDVLEKKMSICIDNEFYDMNYMYSVGHMAIIDGKKGDIKFFQAKGYTLRKETIKDILKGKSFSAKCEADNEVDVIGKKFNEIIEHSKISMELAGVFDGGKTFIQKDFYEMNKRPVLCNFDIIYEDGLEGVLLKITDVSELEKTLRDRNEVLNNIVKIEECIRRKTVDDSAQKATGILGNSTKISEVKYLVYKASKIRPTVLIMGESGTGKTLVAKEIHRLGDPNKPFIHVNCTAIPPNLFESELFGYEKGSFTGARNEGKVGYFELADGGTLFLDEIGELPNEIQVKLLHVLQEKCFYKIGSTRPIHVDVRVIAATNKNLEEEIKNGKFRQDLYYRINVFPVMIPPLRDRKKDIYVLINSILDRLAVEYNMQLKQLSGETFNKLLDYEWPGNVRELENVLERAVSICETNIIHSEHINISKNKENRLLRDVVANAERNAILDALELSNYNKKDAMNRLGISKSAFYEKLNRYNIESR